MADLKAGTRLRSVVCSSEAMVVAAPAGGAEITCGGHPMIPIGEEPSGSATISPDANKGTQIGKRYASEAGDLELLCTKPGEGSLGCGGTALQIKSAKPLPSSD